MTRLLTATWLAAALILGWSWGAAADDEDFGRKPITDLYAFGDSLVDTGNLFALTGGIEPPSPPYSDGRFSNGPVWIETLGPLLGLEVDFETTVVLDPLANNQAVGGAFTDTRNANEALLPNLAGTGILGQVDSFEVAGGEIGSNDLVVVWGGANNYIFDPLADPDQVVADLKQAVEQLADLGARRFVLPNLPDLGDTPLGTGFPADERAFLSAQSQAHNAALAAAAAELRDDEDLAILVLDIERGFETLLEAGTVFANVTVPCLIQQPTGTRLDTGACPALGGSFDAGALGGTMFWDPIHPSTNLHALIAFLAHGALTGAAEAEDEDDWEETMVTTTTTDDD